MVRGLRTLVDETVQMMRSKLPAYFLSQPSSSAVAIYSSQPKAKASSLLSDLLEIPITLSTPIAFAINTAKCPRPPTPTTPTFFPGPAPKTFNGEYTVTPPHNMGAACSGAKPSGILTTKWEGLRWYRAYPPYAFPPFRNLVL